MTKNEIGEKLLHLCTFTPFRIEYAQPVNFFSLNSAHSVGVLNDKKCKPPIN